MNLCRQIRSGCAAESPRSICKMYQDQTTEQILRTSQATALLQLDAYAA